MFLDVDCVSFTKNAIYKLIEHAESGRLAGVEQVDSHISNGRQHYISPVAACISKSVFEKLGGPSAIQNENGDVMESLTTKTEAFRIGIAMIPILKCLGERLWSTPDGRAYGLGTIYGYNSEVLFFHSFCSGSRLPATDHLRHFYSICKKTRFEIEAGRQDACQTVFD